MNLHKFRHFYQNKYLVSLLSNKKYYLSYNYQYRFLWFRVAKVASRTMNNYFIEHTQDGKYVYSSEVGYLPSQFSSYFKFAFVRHPVDRFISCWKNKVFEDNMFGFNERQREEMKELENFISWVELQDLTKADEHIRFQSSLIDMKNIDFVGKIETFDLDFRKVIEATGMPMSMVETKNQSNVKVENSIDEKLSERIKSVYECDMKAFYI